ncbi:anti-sigma-I factor RsgI2-like isoform X9 [Dermacentor albipictus]|uniref:anti-sigma-I factor RsgI2-like isoform X9 n=1 Tax=Dermacentor albipictus TaxID=60249 RepID=UPI0038FD033B
MALPDPTHLLSGANDFEEALEDAVKMSSQLTTYGILLIVSGAFVLLILSLVLISTLIPSGDQDNKTLRAMIPVVVLLLMALVAFVVLTFAFDADLFANKTIGLRYPASGARGAYPPENQTSTVGSSLIPVTEDVKNVQNATPTPTTTTATIPSAVLWPFPKRDICSDSSPCNEQCIGNLFTEPWPMPDPGPWPLPGPNPWPMPEPKPRPMPGPNPGSDSEPEPWTVTDPAPWPMTEPKPWPMPVPHPRPMSKPDPFPMTVPNPGPMSEKTSRPMTQPTSSPMPQPVFFLVVHLLDTCSGRLTSNERCTVSASLPLPGRDPRPKTKRPSTIMPPPASSRLPKQGPSHLSSSQSWYPIMQRNDLFVVFFLFLHRT